MFPNKLSETLPFSWCYPGTWVCLVHFVFLVLLLLFYIVQTGLTMQTGLLYVSYNLSWVLHIGHSVEWIGNFFFKKRLWGQIFQGYRRFYRYLLADSSEKSVIRFTWKLFVSWTVMFYMTAAALILKSYFDRFPEDAKKADGPAAAVQNELAGRCLQIGYVRPAAGNATYKSAKPILATIDQVEAVHGVTTEAVRNVLFWLHLIANVVCINVVFISEVFIMFMITIMYHAFLFIHNEIDSLLGNPDSIFNVAVIHDPMDELEEEMDRYVKTEIRTNRRIHPTADKAVGHGQQQQSVDGTGGGAAASTGRGTPTGPAGSACGPSGSRWRSSSTCWSRSTRPLACRSSSSPSSTCSSFPPSSTSA